jgi:hypothetical protein
LIANGNRLYADPVAIPTETFLRLFRFGAGSAHATPSQLPEELVRGVELPKRERPSWEAEIPLDRLASAGFPVLVVSGGHSAAFDAVCDALSAALSAERSVISGHGPLNGRALQQATRGLPARSGSPLSPARAEGSRSGLRLLVLLTGLIRRVDDVADLLSDRLHLARHRGERVQVDLAEVDVLDGLRQRDAAQSL